MAPKTPKELKEQIDAQNETPAKEGNDRTAEGLSVPRPQRGDFFSNLEKVSKPDE
jgi:hypothetical protein